MSKKNKTLIQRFKNKNPIFLVPDYYCNYSLSLLKIFGAKIIFYSIKENFEPDFDRLIPSSDTLK